MAKATKSPDKKELEKVGQMLLHIAETGYANKKELYKASFLRGMVSGFGGVIGATIVVALLAWILSLFSEIPIIGGLFQVVESTVDSSAQ